MGVRGTQYNFPVQNLPAGPTGRPSGLEMTVVAIGTPRERPEKPVD
jgi:hypothetical protein